MSLFPKLGDYFLWKGKLVQMLWENRGYRTAGFKFVRQDDFPKCPSCGCYLPEFNGIEHIISSPIFQENALPLNQEKDNHDRL